MELSKRLQAVADMVTVGNRVADVGTDHGFLPIYLVRQKRIPSALAMDVREGPLSAAREHIQAYRLENEIQTRLSDGIRNMQPGEADTLVLAGMGGALMLRIMEEGSKIIKSFREFVLQPQSEITLVRKELEKRGFRVVEETMVFEDGKFYPVMKLVLGKDFYTDEAEYRYGRLLIQQKSTVLELFLRKEETLYLEIAEKLKNQLAERKTEKNEARLKEVEQELELIRRTLKIIT